VDLVHDVVLEIIGRAAVGRTALVQSPLAASRRRRRRGPDATQPAAHRAAVLAATQVDAGEEDDVVRQKDRHRVGHDLQPPPSLAVQTTQEVDEHSRSGAAHAEVARYLNNVHHPIILHYVVSHTQQARKINSTGAVKPIRRL